LQFVITTRYEQQKENKQQNKIDKKGARGVKMSIYFNSIETIGDKKLPGKNNVERFGTALYHKDG
jgi:hypothetical protein